MSPASNLLLTAAALAAFATAPALAQAQTLQHTPGGVDPAPGAPGPYAGADKSSFYNVEARVSEMEARISAMAGATARQARSQLAGIKSFLATQRARHGGELRDWDREAATARLNRLEQTVGAG